MGDSIPGQQPPNAQGTPEDEASGELEPEQQAKPAQVPPGDLAPKKPVNGPESKFHG